MADPWVWHRHRDGGRVHGFPTLEHDPIGALVSLCARVVTYTNPTPTEHDPTTDRCGLCVRRAKEATP